MAKHNIDVYYVPTSDFHDSEYVNEYFRGRAYLSGFTGSAGVLVVTKDKAVVWSDGRYYIQGEQQVSNTCVDFYRQQDPNYPTPIAFIQNEIKENGCLGFDGRVVSNVLGAMFEKQLRNKNIIINYNLDLVDEVWEERVQLPCEKVWLYDTKYCGMTAQDKISKIREAMQKVKATQHILTSLDDIAYVLNMRGNDVQSNPVFLSNVIITKDTFTLYIDANKIDEKVATYLKENRIVIKDYFAIYEDVKELGEEDCVLVDEGRCNYAIMSNIPSGTRIYNDVNPSTLMKSVKNSVEIENTKAAHIKDGVAVTKFMYWLKTNVGQIEMDELSVDAYLTNLRAQQEHFLGTSFDTIAGYNANAAMMHYSATAENHAKIEAKGMLLVDSGGQYLEGTTDITRTFGLGEVDTTWKKHFTLVLKGMIQLSKAKFLSGVSGINLDILARQPLWEHGIDYKCGTGHGVGHLLNVHEGPQGIRWQKALGRKEDTALQVGMNVTNEPGVYIAGSHGIRIENELIVKEIERNSDGIFLGFETITFAPIDLDLIDLNYLDESSKEWLNAYHTQVYDLISPALDEAEKAWLKQYTRAI